MKEEKHLQWSPGLKAGAFLLALVLGVALCASAGCALLTLSGGSTAERFEDTGDYRWQLTSMAEELEMYIFLCSHKDALTAEGRARLEALEYQLDPANTNFRYTVELADKSAYLSNGTAEDGVIYNSELITAYDLARDRNIGYYLNLEKAADWHRRVGTANQWNQERYPSDYLYGLEEYVNMVQEQMDLETGMVTVDRLPLAGGETDTPEEEIYLADETTQEESSVQTEPVTEDVPLDEASLDEAASEPESQLGLYYNRNNGESYAVIDGQTYKLDNSIYYVYYVFIGSQNLAYTLSYWVEPGCPVEDEFQVSLERYRLEKRLTEEYSIPLLGSTLVLLALFLGALTILTWCVGWNRKGELALRGPNQMPVEVLALLAAGGMLLTYGVAALATSFWSRSVEIFGGDELSALAGLLALCGLVAVPTCLCAWVILTAQLKTHTLLSRSLCCRGWLWLWGWCKKPFRALRDCWKKLVEGLPLYQKVLLYGGGYGIFLTLWISAVAVDVWMSYGNVGIRLAVVALPLLPPLVYTCLWALDWARMRRQVKKMLEGDFESQLDTGRMLPDIRQHGADLNNLSQGLARAVEERVKSQRFKTELITNVSHDLKTPLTSIINYVDLLKKANIEDETVRGYIEVLDRKSQRLKTLTEDLVEASKAASGTIAVNTEKLDVTELIEQAVAEYEERLRQAALTVVLQKPEKPLMAMADGRHLWRILDNLLANCTKYAMPGTRVYLDASQKGSMAVIEVKNISADPLNIPEEELMKRFVRGDSARSTEGSGLGLSIARNLTAAQKGEFQLVVDGDLFKAVIKLPAADSALTIKE